MTKIAQHIKTVNQSNRKALSIYLTAGFPAKENFTESALSVLDSGADMLEVGFPFSDPLADGPTIQYSSHAAIQNGVTLKDVFIYCEKINSKTDKPLILMGYANPVLKYGVKKFCEDAESSGVTGLIIPDIPLDEYQSFYTDDFKNFEKILLTTPASSDERIKEIDKKSSGFVYCVTVLGTTGAHQTLEEKILSNLKRTYSLTTNNKLLIGFGISSPENIKKFSPYCDGVIVGSAVIKKIIDSKKVDASLLDYIKSLSEACNL